MTLARGGGRGGRPAGPGGSAADVDLDVGRVRQHVEHRRVLRGRGDHEAIETIGEEELLRRAAELAQGYVREGLPLRGEIQVFGYIGHKPG